MGYESWFLSARDPEGNRGVWIRRTAVDADGAGADVAAWCTTFDRATARTVKQVWRSDASPGELTASPGRFSGRASIRGLRADWDLSISANDDPLRPLRPRLLYRLPVPRTKVEVPVPLGTLRGRLAMNGTEWLVDGWPAAVGHNWGREHAEQWVWLHGFHLGVLTWLELVLARVRIGSRLTPWLATGALSTGRRSWSLGAPGRASRCEEVSPVALDAVIPAGSAQVRIEVDAGGPAGTAVMYRDPGGGTRTVVHTGLAPTVVTVAVSRCRSARLHGLAAFEVGSAVGWPGVRPADLPFER